MQRNLIAALFCGFALLWCGSGLSQGNCPYYDTNNKLPIPNYTNAYYYTSASSSCLDIAQFPLSSCLTDTVYRSSSALASDPIGGRVFQAAFNPSNWTGQLLAYQADSTTGIVNPNSLWESGNVLTNKSNNNTPLNPYTFYHPDFAFLQQCSGGYTDLHCIEPILKGYLFNNIYNLSASQGNLLDSGGKYGNLILNYFTGYTTCEYQNVCSDNNNQKFSFRQRPALLGDLINSDPLFVGSEDFNYSSLPESSTSSYQTFVNNKSQVDASNNNSSTNKPRARMVYVGGNDGRLHGFEAGTWDNTANAFNYGHGTEVFSYFPGSIIDSDLSLRAFNTFITNNPLYHRYLVDGSPKAGDAYFSGTWHTVLLGTTGASPPNAGLDPGGSLFALDITNPTNPTFAAGNVLWEFTSNGDLIDNGFYSNNWADGDLGTNLPQPSLARMQNGKWVAIVGNGYNSQNQFPVLYILDISLTPENPKFVIAKLSPCVSTGSINVNNNPPSTITNPFCLAGVNGLSTPIAVDVNNDRKVDYIYAGDLQGNLWKFDVNCSGTASTQAATKGDYLSCQTSSAGTDWQVANGGKPLFVACDKIATTCGIGDRQPITAKPQVGSVGATQANALYSSTQTKINPSVMVYIGTGSYLGLCDLASSSSLGVTCPQQQQFQQQQTFYALWDQNQGTASTDNSIAGRGSLLQQTILTPSSITQTDTNKTAVTNVRVTSAFSGLPCYQTPPCTYQTTDKSGKTTTGQQTTEQFGWYMDLSTPSDPTMPSERSVSFPNLLNGNIVFTTQIPTSDPCNQNKQASGWVMELNAINGNVPSNPAFLNIFGTNPSGNAPNNDLVSVNGASPMPPSGIQSTVGILKTPALIYGQGVVHKYFGGSTGPSASNAGIQMVTDPASTLGRASWRQLR